MTIRIPPGSFEKPDMFPSELLAIVQRVGETTERIRYERLKTRLLQGVNPEINTDREALATRMDQLGFRGDIGQAIQEVERKIAQAATGFDFRGCMDLSRAAFEKIVEEAARRGAAIRTVSLPSSDAGPFNPWKQLLQKCGVLDDKEAEMLQKFYNYVSTAGTHGLGSEAQEARLTKNMVIELGLLLVERVQALTSGKFGLTPPS